MKTIAQMTHRWERTREGLIVVYNRLRRWDPEIILYRGSRVEFESFSSKYDGCEMSRNIIDGRTYPFAHRTKGKAIHAALQIINLRATETVELHGLKKQLKFDSSWPIDTL